MIRLFKTSNALIATAIALSGVATANEKYPLLLDPEPPTAPVKLVQEKENVATPVLLLREIEVAAQRRITISPAEEPDPAPAIATEVVGEGPEKPRALIAVIIDDLGNHRSAGERTVELEGPIACAIMPHTRHAAYLAKRAHASGKEVMLHLPMQPMQMQRIAGPGEISLDTKRVQLSHILQTDLDSVPHVVGVNNHMGSLITRHPGHMRWLMEELSKRGDLFFVDSYTTPSSIAYDMAVEKGVPAARRHVFLDSIATAEHVARQFEHLKRQADINGYALAIGHPYDVTLDYLEAALPELGEQGYELVSVETITGLQNTEPEGHAETKPVQTANAIL